ncbi:Pyridoxal phosphate phosphatase YigL [Arthrobacter saudimassiliensis]|uniref:Pyridoxal phosphate phosphatase YigL n=1 Tax=Arthrobacter saudimassiliensis TaxID=1461584 RepID=A0A078MII9_9MICC|nr:Pyridoxal phosphate phosphatase YigL [Arthrobacter saudimassiliensis]
MRLVASDLDGTIIGPDNRISDRTVAAFRRAAAAGVHIVFVTGRPPRWLGPLRRQIGHEGTVICSNGAVTYDLRNDTVLDARAVPLPDVFAAADIIRGLYPAARFAAESLQGFHLEPGFLEHATAERLGDIQPAPLAETLGRDTPVVKFLTKVDGVSPDELLAKVRPAVAGLVSATHSAPGMPLLEMAAPGLDKAVTLAEYAKALEIDRADVVAFGDMPNDIEMLSWAGRGYAMASGHPDALAAADRSAPAFAEDGVAQVLERLLDRAQA